MLILIFSALWLLPLWPRGFLPILTLSYRFLALPGLGLYQGASDPPGTSTPSAPASGRSTTHTCPSLTRNGPATIIPTLKKVGGPLARVILQKGSVLMPWVLQAPCSVGMPFTGGAHSPEPTALTFSGGTLQKGGYYKRFLRVPVTSPGSRNAILPFLVPQTSSNSHSVVGLAGSYLSCVFLLFPSALPTGTWTLGGP